MAKKVTGMLSGKKTPDGDSQVHSHDGHIHGGHGHGSKAVVGEKDMMTSADVPGHLLPMGVSQREPHYNPKDPVSGDTPTVTTAVNPEVPGAVNVPPPPAATIMHPQRPAEEQEAEPVLPKGPVDQKVGSEKQSKAPKPSTDHPYGTIIGSPDTESTAKSGGESFAEQDEADENDHENFGEEDDRVLKAQD